MRAEERTVAYLLWTLLVRWGGEGPADLAAAAAREMDANIRVVPVVPCSADSADRLTAVGSCTAADWEAHCSA